MKITKREITEIIDSNGGLIGKNDVPTNGSDFESASKKTTDQSIGMVTQPYKYDMLSRFGFTLLPFFEGNKDEDQMNIINDLYNIISDRNLKFLKFYYKNPNKLKSDYRKAVENKFDSQKDDDFEMVNDIIKTINVFFEKISKQIKTIDEVKVFEDKMIDEKKTDEFITKTKDNDIVDNKIKKIAGLINKLNQKDVNKLLKLLEVK